MDEEDNEWRTSSRVNTWIETSKTRTWEDLLRSMVRRTILSPMMMMITRITDLETEENEENTEEAKMLLISSLTQKKWEVKYQHNSNFLLKIYERNL